jgi:hypothetical protein
MLLSQWAIRWGVPLAALKDLERELGLEGLETMPPATKGTSEAAVASVLRLEAARVGVRLWRNNVGGYQDESGRWVRYGLANESKGMNALLKSSDFIGIRPVLITPEHVGHMIGQFVGRETKAAGWTYSGTEREVAQQRWALLVNSCGGDARFCVGEGSLGSLTPASL